MIRRRSRVCLGETVLGWPRRDGPSPRQRPSPRQSLPSPRRRDNNQKEDTLSSLRQRTLHLDKERWACTEMSHFCSYHLKNPTPKQNKLKPTKNTFTKRVRIFPNLNYLESFNLHSLFFLFFSSLHEQIEFQAKGEKKQTKNWFFSQTGCQNV